MESRGFARALALAAFLCIGASGKANAQSAQGTITGRVTDAATGAGVASAQLEVVGTSSRGLSNSEGVFTIRGVTPGTYTVRALRIGHAEGRQSATVSAAQVTTLNFQLKEVPPTMNPVVTTATGDQRRVEVGNAIAQIDAEKTVQSGAVANLADLLTSRAAGVTVYPGTQTGAGVRVRIRGQSSMALSNNPIYVIDGVRVEGATGSSSLSVGGTTPSRIGDLNPEEIESIEIVRGPSASTLYGTDAANGVIVIKTKRGVAGPAQWTYYTEQTALQDRNEYPTAFRAWRTGTTSATNSTASNTVQCFLSQKAAGACAIDSVTSYNLHDDKESTPYGIGYRQQHGLQVRGGNDVVRYFLHGEWENEDGVTKVPEFEQRIMAARRISLLPEQKDPNGLNRVTTRVNLNIALTPKADLTVSTGYTHQNIRLPMSDDAGTAGIAGNTYGGPGMKYNLTATGDTLYGWRQFTPRDIYQATTNQAIDRIISSASTNYRPTNWLVLQGTAGLDFINRADTQICRFQNCPNLGTTRLGYKVDNRTNFYTYTVDVAGTATRRLSDDVESRTVAGVQFFRSIFNRNGARGDQLSPGATTVTAGAVRTADEASSESRTLGGFVEQNIGYRDRLFVTGAIRSDRNSAFGINFKTVFYPKISVSWVASEETFIPMPVWVDQLRFRTAYGASGVQPNNTDALQFFIPATGRLESGDAPAVVLQTLGNANLQPERSKEFEAGVDGTLFNGRFSAEITYYEKLSEDALVSRILPPSLGTGATARLENLGEVRNAGFEYLLTGKIISTDNFGFDLTLNGSYNDNKLVSLGGQPSIGATQQQRAGYPLSGWWSRQLTGWNDKNNNGIIEWFADTTLTEISVTDTSVFIGYPQPPKQMALTGGIDLLDQRLRITVMMDYKGGHKVYNNSERIRCASRFNCSGLLNPNASLEEQAKVVMVREHPSRSVAAYFEDGDFIRLREVAVTYSVPDEWASKLFRGRSLTATASVRNLGTLWTKYSGMDPEAFGTTVDAPSSFQAFGPPTYFALRFNFGF